MLEIRKLQKVVDGKTALDIQSFDLQAGQIAGLVGLTGSGMDVFFSLLTGQIRPTSGVIRLAGLEPSQQKAALSQVVGVMFAEDGLYKNQSALSNLLFQGRLYGLPKERAAEVLVLVGLADHLHTSAGKLTSSLLRRLSFGRAILHQPKLLILQEPFARCDEQTMTLLRNLMRTLVEDGTAILILNSDQAGLTSLCEALYELQDGRVVDVTPQEESVSQQQAFKIPVKAEDKVLLLNPADILYADASDGRAFLVTLEDRLPSQYTLAELEKRLARSGFFRAHRSYLVNLQHVREVIPFTRNAFSLRLDDPAGTQIPLSKSAAGELKELLGY
jgi:ABC-2 type transport system ATP-binding protein